MASNHTSNYGLCQWEATDAVLRTDFNEDNAKIDAALKSQAGSISSLSAQMVNKANTGTVSSLSSQLNQEIQDRQNAVNTEKAAREAADTALAQSQAEQLDTLRGENCWVKLGEVVESQGSTMLDVSLTTPEGRELQEIRLFCNIKGSQTRDAYLLVNHRTDGEYKQFSEDPLSNMRFLSSTWVEAACWVRFFPVGMEDIPVCEYNGYTKQDQEHATYDGTYFLSTLGIQDIQSIQWYVTSGNIVAGSVLRVYGLLK